MKNLTKMAAAVVLILSANGAWADAADDNIAKVCSGLSRAFYNQSPVTGPDANEQEILAKFLDPGTAALVTRAKIIGAAHACGQQTDGAWKDLRSQSASVFPKSAAQNKKFVQVIDCTEARFEKIGLSGRWAVAAKEACPQAQKNYTFYIKDRHSFADAPQ